MIINFVRIAASTSKYRAAKRGGGNWGNLPRAPLCWGPHAHQFNFNQAKYFQHTQVDFYLISYSPVTSTLHLLLLSSSTSSQTIINFRGAYLASSVRSRETCLHDDFCLKQKNGGKTASHFEWLTVYTGLTSKRRAKSVSLKQATIH